MDVHSRRKTCVRYGPVLNPDTGEGVGARPKLGLGLGSGEELRTGLGGRVFPARSGVLGMGMELNVGSRPGVRIHSRRRLRLALGLKLRMCIRCLRTGLIQACVSSRLSLNLKLKIETMSIRSRLIPDLELSLFVCLRKWNGRLKRRFCSMLWLLLEPGSRDTHSELDIHMARRTGDPSIGSESVTARAHTCCVVG